MADKSNSPRQSVLAIPPDDPQRKLAIVQPDSDQKISHIGVVGDTYTILLTDKDTAGRFCLIDMHVPPGGGPPPHRHDFEETFTLLEGELDVVFRGAKQVLRAGEIIVGIGCRLPRPHAAVSVKSDVVLPSPAPSSRGPVRQK